MEKKDQTNIAREYDPAVIEEMHACFRYFYETFSRSPEAFGLMPDRVPDLRAKCSIAATGFMLAAMAVGADFGWIDRADAQHVCDATLKTIYGLKKDYGFYYHFYETEDGERYKKSELSTIDTALMVAGALTAGAYFGGNTLKLAHRIAKDVQWDYFYDRDKKMFRMARYDELGMEAQWDYYAEQLIIYVLAAANGAECAREAYESFGRLHGTAANGKDFVYTWCGTLFTYQFSHAYVDFAGKTDAHGFDWFANSVTASINDRLFCAAQPGLYPDGIWGLTSCATPVGYRGHIGSAPSGNGNRENLSDGTVAPCGALGSIVFTPQESVEVTEKFTHYDGLTGNYGLYDSFNPTAGWIAKCYISIDKGITLLMGANHYRRTVWNAFNSLPEIRKAMRTLGFTTSAHS